MTFVCLEIAFLILGYRPWHNEDYSIKAQPANAYIGDPQLGIQNNPGQYQIHVNDSLSFSTLHLPNGEREVPGVESAQQELLVLGCSFTYGFGVEDEDTFAARLQKELPDINLRNKAVIGYGTVQSYQQLQAHLANSRPDMVLLVFSSFHPMRNTLSPEYRHNLTTGYKRSSHSVDNLMDAARFPYLSACGEPVQYESWDSLYQDWPGRHYLASVNWFQTLRDRYREDMPRQILVTTCLMQEMDAMCAKQGIPFGVVCLDTSQTTLAIKESVQHIPWLDVEFDFTKGEWTNHPYDSHPSAAGHTFIANKVLPFIKSLRHAE
jgi:hypothetical protein